MFLDIARNCGYNNLEEYIEQLILCTTAADAAKNF